MRRVMQFDTLRPRLIKLAARVIELKIQVKIHPAVQRPRSGDLRHAPQPPAAPRHLTAGALAPAFTRSPSTSSPSDPDRQVPSSGPHRRAHILRSQPIRVRHYTH